MGIRARERLQEICRKVEGEYDRCCDVGGVEDVEEMVSPTKVGPCLRPVTVTDGKTLSEIGESAPPPSPHRLRRRPRPSSSQRKLDPRKYRENSVTVPNTRALIRLSCRTATGSSLPSLGYSLPARTSRADRQSLRQNAFDGQPASVKQHNGGIPGGDTGLGSRVTPPRLRRRAGWSTGIAPHTARISTSAICAIQGNKIALFGQPERARPAD